MSEEKSIPEDSKSLVDDQPSGQNVAVDEPDRSFFVSDDFWAIVLGMVLLLAAVAAVASVSMNQGQPVDVAVETTNSTEAAEPEVAGAEASSTAVDEVAKADGEAKPIEARVSKPVSALKRFIGKPGEWTRNPLHAFGINGGKSGTMLGILGMYFLSSGFRPRLCAAVPSALQGLGSGSTATG